MRARWLPRSAIPLLLLAVAAVAPAQHPRRLAAPGAGLRRLSQLPPRQQEQELRQNPEFQSLPAGKQKQMMNGLRRLNAMPSAKQKKIIRQLREFGKLSPQQRQGLRQVYEKFQAMPPADRDAFRKAYNQLRGLPPQQRQLQLNSLSTLTPPERATLQHALALQLPAALVNSKH
ncbi:MAG: DUF3106 domain-containing protein [Terriglobales bacterium]